MARKFLASSTQYLEVTVSGLVGSVPVTLACWAYPPTDGSAESFFSYADSTQSSTRIELRMNAGAAGDPAQAFFNTRNAASSSAVNFNAWNSLVGVFDTANSRAIWLNGAQDTNGLGSTDPMGVVDTIAIGRRSNSTPAHYANAAIAWCAMWDVALTDAESISFCNGLTPLKIRPQNLVFFAPLGGLDGADDDDRDIIGGLSLTPTNTPTTQQHPGGLIYANSPIMVTSTSATAGYTPRQGLQMLDDLHGIEAGAV